MAIKKTNTSGNGGVRWRWQKIVKIEVENWSGTNGTEHFLPLI
jgi:hypothetical protein